MTATAAASPVADHAPAADHREPGGEGHAAGHGEDLPWARAEAWCRDLELAGRSDWRLPTLAELETLHDPDGEDGLAPPLELDGCCAWSSTSLEDRPADRGGPGFGASAQYFWGFLFEGGTRYYSFRRIPDGRALCVRDAD